MPIQKPGTISLLNKLKEWYKHSSELAMYFLFLPGVGIRVDEENYQLLWHVIARKAPYSKVHCSGGHTVSPPQVVIPFFQSQFSIGVVSAMCVLFLSLSLSLK